MRFHDSVAQVYHKEVKHFKCVYVCLFQCFPCLNQRVYFVLHSMIYILKFRNESALGSSNWVDSS